jgi:hypothetical protein
VGCRLASIIGPRGVLASVLRPPLASASASIESGGSSVAAAVLNAGSISSWDVLSNRSKEKDPNREGRDIHQQ